MEPTLTYTPPDFSQPQLRNSPPARISAAPADGIAPDGFHATSNLPEYIRLADGTWVLVSESRMDAVLVVRGNAIEAVEARRLRQGELVVLGRSENGEEGILVHAEGFAALEQRHADKFSFRRHVSRETAFSVDYDELYGLLRFEREHGNIVWVLGPAVVFDFDARSACESVLIEMNSIPCRPSAIMRLTALQPPPPTPTTLILANDSVCLASILISSSSVLVCLIMATFA